MKHLIVFSIFILLHSASFANQSYITDKTIIEKEELINKLDSYLMQYKIINKNSDSVEKLFLLDKKISNTINKFVKSHRELNYRNLMKKKYEKIGLGVGHYSELIEYSGKLLSEAHKLNPNSAFRKFTLFTTILGENGDMPNVNKAHLYMKEFPNGPYIVKVYSILATFYSDYYQVMKRLVENHPLKHGIKYDCFEPYFSKQPYKEQMKAAQQNGIKYYNKAENASKNSRIATYYNKEKNELKDGSTFGWHWCGD